jgi:hypothetical protein
VARWITRRAIYPSHQNVFRVGLYNCLKQVKDDHVDGDEYALCRAMREKEQDALVPSLAHKALLGAWDAFDHPGLLGGDP